MLKKLSVFHSKLLTAVGVLIFSLLFIASPLKAQQSPEEDQLKPLRSDVGIVGFTGNLSWRSIPHTNSFETNSITTLGLEFRNIRMLSSHVGIGFKIFTNVFVADLFEEISLDGSGIGPVLRYYPLDSNLWQPYVQASGIFGYELSFGDGREVREGIRFRTNLRGGLTFRATNAFGIFLEAGPSWAYDSAFNLDATALQFDLGIELFLFN